MNIGNSNKYLLLFYYLETIIILLSLFFKPKYL